MSKTWLSADAHLGTALDDPPQNEDVSGADLTNATITDHIPR